LASFDSIPEQAEAKRLLAAALADGPAHAYVFHGPAGVGKRATAVAFASELLGGDARVERRLHPDLYVLEPVGDLIRIDAVREMRRDLHADGDQRYRLGFVIEHNPQGTAMGGSCIFGHLWKTPDSATAGCTAMAPGTMQSLLRWLDAKAQPVFVLLPIDEYRKLQATWRLPRLP